MPQRITEALGTATATGPGRVKLTIITPGQGSSGTYSPELLEQAAKDKVFPRGTQSHVNHSTRTEEMDRPEGDLRNLAGVLLEDARWDGEALVAEARIGSAWRSFVEEFGEFIGVSISAAAEIAEDGTVARLIPDPFNRVDLVTVAGRGGRIAEVLEAARVVESRSLVRETTANDVEMWLDAALRDRFTTATGGGGYMDYPYSRDHDDQYVYYRHLDRWWRLPYTVTPTSVTLDGEPVEVRRRTEYDPVDTTTGITESPAGPGGAPHHTEQAPPKKESDMPEITQEELTQLRENASRATQLEQENKALRENADKAARQARVDRATAAVREAFGADAPAFYVTAAERAAADEDYDHEAFTAMVNEAAAARESANGAGEVTGAGNTTAAEAYVRPSDTDRTDDILAIRV